MKYYIVVIEAIRDSVCVLKWMRELVVPIKLFMFISIFTVFFYQIYLYNAT